MTSHGVLSHTWNPALRTTAPGGSLVTWITMPLAVAAAVGSGAGAEAAGDVVATGGMSRAA